MEQNELQEMVTRVSWFSKIDYPIFEFFRNHDIEVSPKVLAENIGYDRNYTGKRLRVHRDAGLLEQHDTGLYELTEKGRQFVRGDLPASEVEGMDPNGKTTD